MKNQILRMTALLAVFLALALFVSPMRVEAAARTASLSGNWSNTATWGGAAVPTATDTCTVNAGVIVTVDTAAVCSTLTFAAGATSNSITISGSNSLTISGAITMNGTTANTGTQPTILAVGDGTVSAASIALIPGAGNLGSNNRRTQITIGTGTLNVTGNITTPNVTTGTSTGVLFTSSGTLNIGGALMSDVDALFTASTGTVNYNGSAAQTVATYTYNNLTISGSNVKTLAANTTIGGNLTVNAGTLNLSTFTANRSAAGGTLTVANGATMQLAGATNFPTNYNTVLLGDTSTIEYNGTVAQTVSNRSYGNLTLSGSNTKTWTRTANGTNITGTVTITGTATFALAGNFTSNVGGDWTRNSTATFSNTAGTIAFNKAGTANLNVLGTTGTETFCKLTINNGTLLDTNDDLVAVSAAGGCNVLTVTGALRREAPAQTITSGGAAVNFSDSRNRVAGRITQTSGTNFGSTNFTVTVNQSPTTLLCGSTTLGGTPVLRHFNITPTTLGGAATLRLYYDETYSTTNVAIYHCDGTTWQRLGGTYGNDGRNYVELTGVTAFSPFAIGGGSTSPTAVTLTSFDAQGNMTDNVLILGLALNGIVLLGGVWYITRRKSN